MKKLFTRTNVVLFFFMMSLPLAAQGIMPAGMTSLANSVKEVLTGDFVKILLACFLCGSAIAYAFNKDNEKIKRNCIAVMVGAAVLICAQQIVNAVWDASQ